jgi:hypothetical protein
MSSFHWLPKGLLITAEELKQHRQYIAVSLKAEIAATCGEMINITGFCWRKIINTNLR